jgi:hypothetical protein
MVSIDTDPDIFVGYSRLSPNAVWCFFYEIHDVPTLTAAKEQGEAWRPFSTATDSEWQSSIPSRCRS